MIHGWRRWETGYFATKSILRGAPQRTGSQSLFYSVMDIRGLARRILGRTTVASKFSAMLKIQHSSLVIDTLSKGIGGIDGDGVAVAYVYCDFSTPNMQSTSAVLGSVLRQVVGALAEIPDGIQQAFERAKRQADGCGLRLPEILDMLTKSVSSLKRVFICIDALDEFPTKHRAQLWDSLRSIVRECPKTRLFLTGRPQIRTEVEGYLLEEAGMVTIEPTSEDIRRYIEKRLKQALDKSIIDKKLRADIRRVIPKRVSGMYVLTRNAEFHKVG